MSGKTKGFISEFKEFALRGNVIDLAIGIIIGAAFQKIITSLINDMIMPFVGLVTGGKNFNEQFVILKLPEGVNEASVTSLTEAQTLGVTTFNYGAFITSVVDFVIVALVVFLIVKAINRMAAKKKAQEAVAIVTKKCPFCQSEISIEATRCPNCTSQL